MRAPKKKGSSSNVKRWQGPIVCLALAALTFLVFGQTLGFGFVNYDDPDYVYENPAVTAGLTLHGIVSAFCRVNSINWDWVPLTTISHMLDCQFYGLNPAGHHLTNVILHTATVIALFLVLRRMTGALWRSAFVAAVFAIHPLRVESVAWVTERKDVLSGLFFMLTIAAYARYVRRPTSAVRYGLVLFLFALGLMCKAMLVTLPFLLLLLDYWPLQREEPRKFSRLVAEKLPLLALSAADCVPTILAQRDTMHFVQGLDFSARLSNAVVSYATYIGQMVYPVGLAVFYPHPGKALSLGTVGLSVLVLCIISAGVLWGRRNHPYLLVGWLWYLGMLVPVIGLVQAGVQARADRFTYLPQIGLYLMAAWGAEEVSRAWRWRRVVLGSAAAAILASLFTVAFAQTRYWKESVTLWTHTLACTSNNYIAENNLGNVLTTQRTPAEVMLYYERALQIKPDYAEAHYNLGNVLAAQGKLAEAVAHYERAIELNPDAAQAHFNLGLTLARQGNLAEACAHYERVVQLEPDFVPACNNLGDALADQGKGAEAIRFYERSLRLKPDDAAVHNNLGLALAGEGKLAEAIAHYERAIQLKPDDVSATYNLGLALAGQGKVAEAMQHFQRALNLATAQNKTAAAETIRNELKSYQPALPQTQTP